MRFVQGGTIFEELGLQYLGPVDGHDIIRLVEVFQNIKEIANYKPVIVHALTKKGKGYEVAENDIQNMHGVGEGGRNLYTDVFSRKIVDLAKVDDRIVCVSAAMPSGTGLLKFAELYPERFFDVGIAESHAVTFAAGMASEGFKPFVCIYSTFLQRAFDQIYHDVFLQNLGVRFIIDKAGVPGGDGKTHSGIYDISLLQNFDNFVIMAPALLEDFEDMLEFAKDFDGGPVAIRFPKTGPANVSEVCSYKTNGVFDMRMKTIQTGEGTAVVAFGALLETVVEASKMANTKPTIVDGRFIMPFDFDCLYDLFRSHERVVIIEEGVFGGVSNIVLRRMLIDGLDTRGLTFLNASKGAIFHGTREEQLEFFDMSVRGIASLL